MQATFLDLRRRMADILRALERNERVTVTYRGRKVAVLVTAAEEDGVGRDVAGHPACGMWADRDDMADVDGHVRRLREGRRHAL